jgi:hypothetical protein
VSSRSPAQIPGNRENNREFGAQFALSEARGHGNTFVLCHLGFFPTYLSTGNRIQARGWAGRRAGSGIARNSVPQRPAKKSQQEACWGLELGVQSSPASPGFAASGTFFVSGPHRRANALVDQDGRNRRTSGGRLSPELKPGRALSPDQRPGSSSFGALCVCTPA